MRQHLAMAAAAVIFLVVTFGGGILVVQAGGSLGPENLSTTIMGLIVLGIALAMAVYERVDPPYLPNWTDEQERKYKAEASDFAPQSPRERQVRSSATNRGFIAGSALFTLLGIPLNSAIAPQGSWLATILFLFLTFVAIMISVAVGQSFWSKQIQKAGYTKPIFR